MARFSIRQTQTVTIAQIVFLLKNQMERCVWWWFLTMALLKCWSEGSFHVLMDEGLAGGCLVAAVSVQLWNTAQFGKKARVRLE